MTQYRYHLTWLGSKRHTFSLSVGIFFWTKTWRSSDLSRESFVFVVNHYILVTLSHPPRFSFSLFITKRNLLYWYLCLLHDHMYRLTFSSKLMDFSSKWNAVFVVWNTIFIQIESQIIIWSPASQDIALTTIPGYTVDTVWCGRWHRRREVKTKKERIK